jgi:hypothetical protein
MKYIYIFISKNITLQSFMTDTSFYGQKITLLSYILIIIQFRDQNITLQAIITVNLHFSHTNK